MNKEGNIDLERISSSIETLSSISNIVNLVDLSDYFEEIEKKFRQINFEHDNCLNYKQSINLIYSDLERIKRKINELTDALIRTKQNYTQINYFSEGDIKEFSEIYKTTSASEELAKLVGTPNQINLSDLTANISGAADNITTISVPETTPVQEKQPIDTVPIGIAIGATGVAGSIGAVVVDSIYDKREKHQVRKNDVYLEDYKDEDSAEEKDDSDKKSEEIAQGPYHAVRFAREADHFYGNQLENKLKDNDEEYLDDEEDDDYDNF